MGLQQDFKDLGEKLSKLREDPEKFRFALAIAMMVFGMLAIKMPLSMRIDGKRLDLVQAEILAERAERVMKLRGAAVLFEERLDHPADSSDWQAYLYKVVAETGVAMPKQEESRPKVLYDFQQITLPIQVTGTYSQIWNFIDTIERGSRMMRFDVLSITVSEGILILECELIGITRPRREGEGSSFPPPSEPGSEEEDIA